MRMTCLQMTPHPPSRRTLLRAIALCALAGGMHVARAARLELRAIATGESDAERHIVDSLRARFQALSVSSDVQTLSRRAGPAVYLAIGPAALQATLDAELAAPVIALFVASQTFQSMLRSRPKQQASITAIHAEASPEAQLQLIAAMYQHRVTVGILLGEASAVLEPALRRAARRFDLEVIVRRASPGAPVLRELAYLAGATVLLAVPDPAIYNPDSLPALLESTYRRGQPVVGFSPGLVKAGTLAAAYASTDDVLAQLAQILGEIDDGHLPEPQYPAYWRVSVNDSVARSLNLVVAAEARRLVSQPPPALR